MNKENNTTRDAIKNYFTEEVFSRIREMSNNEMKTHLKELEGTPLWFAILKYSQERTSIVQNSLLVIDPVKNATEIARYQGMITGMLDLQDAVLSLKYEAKKAEDPKNKEEANKDELGGSYGKY